MALRPLFMARAAACLTLLALAGCGGVSLAPSRIAQAITPYRIDIVQGNVVSKEQVEALRTGMERQAVRDLLGTPLMQSVFHADRWDYVFTLVRQGEPPQLRRVSVFFKDDRLTRFEADPLPSEAEFVASLVGRTHSEKAPPLEASEDKLKAFPAPAKVAEPQARPPVPASYPPLEPGSN